MIVTSKQVVQVEGRAVQLTNLDKVLWPKQGFTKADLLDYHVRMQTLTSAHWGSRALTVTRYPHGVDGEFFFQKNVPTSAPPWVVTNLLGETEYVIANDLSTIIWLANSAAIEFHPSTFQIGDPNIPSYAIIDLDPTKPLGFTETVDMAKLCGDLLLEIGLRGYPKFSGATGIHIYIPLEAHYDFKISSELVRLLGVSLQRLYPTQITLERLIRNRRGIYIDYLQNHQGKTIVGVYSPRPTPEGTVSTPVDWVDLDYYQPQDFTIKTVPQWVAERGDLFGDVLYRPQSLEHFTQIFSMLKP